MSTINQKDQIGCIDAATGIIGDKWIPLLLRSIHNEKSIRFCKLQDSANGINPRTLSSKLVLLEDAGIIEKIQHTKSNCEYKLTEKGESLTPMLNEMHLWSSKYPVSALS
jgi:DNA-binding HxlR family transcriptional regulator